MNNYTEIKGDLIQLAKAGQFDVIAHGCNCFCNMKAGIAPQMARAFGCNLYPMEDLSTIGDINKLGQIEYGTQLVTTETRLVIVNIYSQYIPNVALKPLDYEALTLGLRKINHTFEGKHIGLPQIGAGLAGGDWTRIKEIIQRELKDMKVTVVIYNG
jgi:O-acetyl-ADP-ribose deacetylase (regulator of RNase III)